MTRFDGQVVVVTGSSRGIGAAIARQFAREGARVVVNYVRSQNLANQVVEDINSHGNEARAFQADVREESEVKAMVQFAEERFGRIDVLVANAATVRNQLLAGMSTKDWNEVIQTNLSGAFLCAREVYPHLVAVGLVKGGVKHQNGHTSNR